jgi:transposase
VEAERRIAELEAQLAAKDAVIAQQAAHVAELTEQVAALSRQVAALTELLGRNSGNSNKPPSSDPPSTRAQRRAKAKLERKRGGQPGHLGKRRVLLPVEQVDKLVDHFPPECENCWAQLPQTLDPSAQRYQTTELPQIKPHTTEDRLHAVVCPCCKHKTRASHEVIAASPFGPRLSSVVALLTGVYHLSRRSAVSLLQDIVGVQISLGAVSAVEARVSDAVKPAVDEAWTQVEHAEVKHTDGTSWFSQSLLCSLWTVATAAATVFKIVADGKRQTLQELMGKQHGILVSDRATALHFWAMHKRQICWAHLLRKFVSFSEREGLAAAIGSELLDYARILFAYWHDFQAGKLSRDQLRTHMAPLRTQLETALERAAASDTAVVAGSCADILEHRAALWTFIDCDGVEPTNNHAERELRAFVLWRKRSFGTQSDRGNRFAERLMTVAHTARKQHVNVLAFLTACYTAALGGERAPPLLAA